MRWSKSTGQNGVIEVGFEKNNGGILINRRRALARIGAMAVTMPSLVKFFGGSTVASGLLHGCGSEEVASEDVSQLRVALAWINNVEYAGLFVAQAKSLYSSYGVKPIFLPGGPNAPMPSVSVAAAAAQLGFDNDLRRFIEAINLGNDFVIIGAQYQRSPGGVISLANRPVRRAEDLVGCRFLGQEGVKTTVDAALTLAGLPLEYTYLPAGYSVSSLVENQGDAYSGFAVNQPVTLENEYGMKPNIDYFFTSWADLGLHGYANMLFCHRRFLDENFQEAVSFLAGTIQGWRANFQNPAFGVDLVMSEHGRNLGLDRDQQMKQNLIQADYMKSELTQQKGLFWVDAGVLEEKMYPSLLAGGIEELPDADSVVDTRVLEAAYELISKPS